MPWKKLLWNINEFQFERVSTNMCTSSLKFQEHPYTDDIGLIDLLMQHVVVHKYFF